MRRPSTLLSRLALALLALLGFVAPLSAVEADRVVQTTGGKPSPVETHERARPAAVRAEATAPRLRSGRTVFATREAEVSRRYLLHRAWLI